jgi:hypothetical protein
LVARAFRPIGRTLSSKGDASPHGSAGPAREGAISRGSARRRAAYNWFILKGLGDRLREVYEADLAAPLPDHLTKLVEQLAEPAQEQGAMDETPPDNAAATVSS